jgi:hypothetical protein
VEVFFGIITRQAIRRGSFDSVKQLTTAIRAFIDGYNQRYQPFVCGPKPWTTSCPEQPVNQLQTRDTSSVTGSD